MCRCRARRRRRSRLSTSGLLRCLPSASSCIEQRRIGVGAPRVGRLSVWAHATELVEFGTLALWIQDGHVSRETRRARKRPSHGTHTRWGWSGRPCDSKPPPNVRASIPAVVGSPSLRRLARSVAGPQVLEWWAHSGTVVEAGHRIDSAPDAVFHLEHAKGHRWSTSSRLERRLAACSRGGATDDCHVHGRLQAVLTSPDRCAGSCRGTRTRSARCPGRTRGTADMGRLTGDSHGDWQAVV